MTVRKVMLATSTYAFPLVATPLLAWAWLGIAHRDWRLVTLVLGVPIIFGYATVIVAARVLRRWSMTGRWQIGGAYVHHGFIYASKLAFVLLLATRDPMAVRSWTDLFSIAILVGAATAFGGWWHDVYAIREGKIVFRDLDARAAEETLASFAPPTYFAVGATYAIVTIASWQVVTAQPESFVLVFLVALTALCIGPSIVFFAIDGSARESLRARTVSRTAR